jgi:hypothetical protein
MLNLSPGFSKQKYVVKYLSQQNLKPQEKHCLPQLFPGLVGSTEIGQFMVKLIFKSKLGLEEAEQRISKRQFFGHAKTDVEVVDKSR